MSNSDPYYNVTITFNHTPPEGLYLILTNGQLQTITEGNLQSLKQQLKKGVYHLKATFIDYFEEYFLQVIEDNNFIFDFKYPSTAPILNFVTTHEYYSVPAEQYSLEPTLGNEAPNFLFYAAAYDKDHGADQSSEGTAQGVLVEDIVSRFSLSPASDATKVIDLTSAYTDYQKGVVVFSTQLTPGQYFLKYSKENETRIFPLLIYDGYQTQFFIRYCLSPDFANCFFYISNKGCFSHDAMEYLVLDRLQYAFKEICNYKLLSELDLNVIKNSPYLLSLVHILHKATSKSPEEFEQNMAPFAGAIWLPLPDITILESLHDNKFLEDSDQLPIVGGIMAKCLAVENNMMQYLPGSMMDRVADHIQFDLFWNNFSFIESIAVMKKSYEELVKKSDYYLIREEENSFFKMSKAIVNKIRPVPKNTQQRRLNILLGENPSVENLIPERLSMIVNSIGNVSQIAQKLNIPATTVMRNYKDYNDIFNDITK